MILKKGTYQWLIADTSNEYKQHVPPYALRVRAVDRDNILIVDVEEQGGWQRGLRGGFSELIVLDENDNPVTLATISDLMIYVEQAF